MLKTNALKIALIYAVVSFLWIFFSDRLLMVFFEETVKLTVFQSIKGTFFVLASAILIFFLVRREIRHKNNLIKMLDESEQWYKTLVENIPRTDLYLFDTEQSIIKASGSALEEKGLSLQDVKGQTINQLPFSQRLRKFLTLHFDSILEGQEVMEEIHLGDTWYELRGCPLRDDNGLLYGGIAALINVSSYKSLIQEKEEQNKEYEALYEEYQATNEDLKNLNEQLRLANDKLKKSEERYRSFIRQSSEAIYRMDLTEPMSLHMPEEQKIKHLYHKAELKECNEAFLKMYGAESFDQLEGKTLADFHGGDDIPENLELVQVFLRNNCNVEERLSYETDKEGNIHYFSNNTIGIVENDYLIRLWGTQTDITERIRAFEQMQEEHERAEESEQKYKALFNNLNDAAVLYRAYEGEKPGEILEVNETLTRLSGYKPKDLKGKSVAEMPLKDPEVAVQNAKTLRQQRDIIRETVIYDKYNRALDVEMSSHWFTYKEKSYILTLIRDISGRKKAERNMADAYHFTNSILNNLPEGVAVYDKSLRIISWNDTMEAFSGKKAGAVIGKTFYEVFKPYANILQTSLQQALEGKTTQTEDYQMEGGRWFNSQFSPNYAADGSVNSVNSITADITQRKHAEAELIKAKEHAEESDRLKTSFLTNMSHEVRTPLNAIVGFSDLLAKYRFSVDSQREYLNIIKRGSDQLLQIINDILTISLLETGQIKISEESFHLNRLLDQLLKDLRKRVEECEKPLETQATYYFPDNADLIKGDREKLQQIFANLLSNAEKFTSKGYIELGYTVSNYTLHFYVKDTGEGIPEDQQQIIFERFRQLNENKEVPISGTGLGLAIARGFVNLMGGKIRVSSTPGKGARFEFMLPYYPG